MVVRLIMAPWRPLFDSVPLWSQARAAESSPAPHHLNSFIDLALGHCLVITGPKASQGQRHGQRVAAEGHPYSSITGAAPRRSIRAPKTDETQVLIIAEMKGTHRQLLLARQDAHFARQNPKRVEDRAPLATARVNTKEAPAGEFVKVSIALARLEHAAGGLP